MKDREKREERRDKGEKRRERRGGDETDRDTHACDAQCNDTQHDIARVHTCRCFRSLSLFRSWKREEVVLRSSLLVGPPLRRLVFEKLDILAFILLGRRGLSRPQARRKSLGSLRGSQRVWRTQLDQRRTWLRQLVFWSSPQLRLRRQFPRDGFLRRFRGTQLVATLLHHPFFIDTIRRRLAWLLRDDDTQN